jgi:hypothetical protein
MNSYWLIQEYGGVIFTITLFFFFIVLTSWLNEDIFSDDDNNFIESWD